MRNVRLLRALGRYPVGIEAAHIRWHSQQGPDEITNALALCALHHTLFDLNYFPLKKSLPGNGRLFGRGGCLTDRGQLARLPILTRLWANTPCPHQIAVPVLLSRRVRGPIVEDLDQLTDADLTNYVTEALRIGAHTLPVTGQVQESRALERLLKDVGDKTADSTTKAAEVTGRAVKEASEAITRPANDAKKAITEDKRSTLPFGMVSLNAAIER